MQCVRLHERTVMYQDKSSSLEVTGPFFPTGCTEQALGPG